MELGASPEKEDPESVWPDPLIGIEPQPRATPDPKF